MAADLEHPSGDRAGISGTLTELQVEFRNSVNVPEIIER
jgi:hypothetical protein